MAILDDVRLALKLTVTDYDPELSDLIDAAALDLGIAGVIPGSEPLVGQAEADMAALNAYDNIVKRAIITYCRLHFQALESGDWSNLKRSYDEQKAQLATATGWTDWLVRTDD